MVKSNIYIFMQSSLAAYCPECPHPRVTFKFYLCILIKYMLQRFLKIKREVFPIKVNFFSNCRDRKPKSTFKEITFPPLKKKKKIKSLAEHYAPDENPDLSKRQVNG